MLFVAYKLWTPWQFVIYLKKEIRKKIINPEKIINFEYYGINQLPRLKEFTDKNSLSFAHLNACSLLKNLHALEHLTQATKTDFDISE